LIFDFQNYFERAGSWEKQYYYLLSDYQLSFR
jgi:hypothetical protein